MRYDVLCASTGKSLSEAFPHRPYVVTPDGKVAWWDQSQGWDEDEHQEKYKVVILASESTDALLEQMVQDFPELGAVLLVFDQRLSVLEKGKRA